MSEKVSARTSGESINYTIEDLPYAQDIMSKIDALKEQLRSLEEQKGSLKADRDNNEKLNPGVFRHYGGESVYQQKRAELDDQVSNLESQLHDVQSLYQELGGDKIDSLKAELLDRTNGRTRGTWSAEAMITFRALQQAQRDFETNYAQYQDKHLNQSKDMPHDDGGEQPIDINTVEGAPTESSDDLGILPIDAYSFNDEDIDLVSPSMVVDGAKKPKNLDDLSDREKYLLNQLESQKEDFVKELESLKSQLDALKKTPATLVNVAPERGEKKSRLLSKWKKIGAGVLAAVSFLGLGFGAGRMLDNDKTEVPQSQPAATAEADVSVAKIAPDFPYNQGQFGELQDLGEAEASEESLSGYDLSNTHEYYKDGGRESLWAYGPALPTDKDGLVRELSTRVENDPTLAAAWDSTCFAENMSTEEAQACIDLFHTDANAWKESGEKLKQLLNDQNTTFDFFDLTGSHILSSYINDDGKYGKLLTNDIISDGTGVHIVNKQMGIDFYMRTNCGGQVFKFIEGGSTPTLPGIYTSETPPPPNTDKPSVPVTPLTPDNPPTPPNIDVPPAEVLEQKDSTVDINVNEHLSEQNQMGDQAGDMTSDPSQGGDTAPAEQPSETYTPPVQETESQVADEAEQSQVEQRQKQANQGVETGDGKTTASGEVAPNNGTVDPNASN